MAWLQVNKGSLKGQIIQLRRGELVLGRDKDLADIVISTEEIVSRKHATIHFEGDCYYIEDDSRNGTYLNTDRILRNTRIPLRQNDRIVICENEFEAVFFDGTTQASLEADSSTLEA